MDLMVKHHINRRICKAVQVTPEELMPSVINVAEIQ